MRPNRRRGARCAAAGRTAPSGTHLAEAPRRGGRVVGHFRAARSSGHPQAQRDILAPYHSQDAGILVALPPSLGTSTMAARAPDGCRGWVGGWEEEGEEVYGFFAPAPHHFFIAHTRAFPDHTRATQVQVGMSSSSAGAGAGSSSSAAAAEVSLVSPPTQRKSSAGRWGLGPLVPRLLLTRPPAPSCPPPPRAGR